MTAKKTQDTAKKQSTHKRNTSGLIPFKKGPDPRRNISGRNAKGFDDIRKLFLSLGNEEITINGKTYTRFEAIGLALSADKKHMREFLEYAIGKVPQAVDVTSGGEKLQPPQVIEVIRTVKDDEPAS